MENEQQGISPDDFQPNFETEGNSASGSPPIPQVRVSNPRIITPVPPRAEIQEIKSLSDTAQIVSEQKDISRIAKSYEPLIGKIVSIFDAAGVNLVSSEAKRRNLSSTQVEILEQKVAMSEETHSLITTSGSRIAARHVTNPEHMDYIALAGGLATWAGSILFAIKELKNLPAQPPVLVPE